MTCRRSQEAQRFHRDHDGIIAGAIVSCGKSGYLQHVDHGALVAAARAVDALIVLRFRPGECFRTPAVNNGILSWCGEGVSKINFGLDKQ